MANEIWTFAEQRRGGLRGISLEAVHAARQLADRKGAKVVAVLLGQGVAGEAERLGAYGADEVRLVESEVLETYSSEGYAATLAELIAQGAPEIVILGGSAMGRDLAPRTAAKLKAGLIADCIEISLNDAGRLEAVRPAYAGKTRLRVHCPNAAVQMATIRPNVFGTGEPQAGRTAQITRASSSLSRASLRAVVTELATDVGGKVDLTEASIIVSGGRGIKGPENFTLLEELAGVLGAAVGASRAVVDAGWREHAAQVGQTGKTVSPNLYIACGISGAIQHLAGMSSSKCIVAINKDPDAPIFKVADYGIAGDLFEIVPLLKEEFRALLAEK
ncbi:MAG: electron transfer flavoprotein subunit alpha/FixB family protein [Candidatus Tectomicrobia bacterium]|nr:electron transfer flavoprotein subunit alpha/FixB family protein [Candidatus Tectomicrobia bacterium]